MWLFRSFHQLCFDHSISCTCDIFDQLCLALDQLCVSFNQLQMWLFRSVVLDIWSFERSFSISCSSNIFGQLCVVKILSCGLFSIDWMFYIWAVVMYVIFSISSCDVLHCFWQNWSIFCRGLEFCKRTPGGCFRLCVGVTMELRQNIPGRFIQQTPIWEGVCGRRLFDIFVNAVFAQNDFSKIYPKCREQSVQSVSLFRWVTFLHDNSNLV